MKVADVMQKDLVTVPMAATVGEAIIILADAHVTGLPVVDRKRLLVGVLSTTDLLTSLAEQGREGDLVPLLDETTVSEIMTPRPKTVAPDVDVREAAQGMAAKAAGTPMSSSMAATKSAHATDGSGTPDCSATRRRNPSNRRKPTAASVKASSEYSR